ncbi:MAG TPA: hypothetical protein VIJ14_09350 [Rhabdochlamydiaceae bacterium]
MAQSENNIKDSIHKILDKNLAAKLREESPKILKKGFEAYTKLNSQGVKDSTIDPASIADAGGAQAGGE